MTDSELAEAYDQGQRDFIGFDFRGFNLEGFNLEGVNFTGANLEKANLKDANLKDANLRKAKLLGVILTGADLAGAKLPGADLAGADLAGAKLAGAKLPGADLVGAKLAGADLCNATLEGANLAGANLIDAKLREARLSGADFTGADLTDADLTDADLTSAELIGAELVRANLTRATLVVARLGNANLTRAILTEAALTEASLGEANLTGANLSKSELYNANLERADLTDAILGGVHLANTKLAGAKFAGVDFINHDFSHMDLEYVDLGGANLRNIQGRTDGRMAMCLNNTRTHQTQFPKVDGDAWSILRSSYTGPKFALHLLVLIIFIAPFVGRAALWKAASAVEDVTLTELEAVLLNLADKMEESSDSTAVGWGTEVGEVLKNSEGRTGLVEDIHREDRQGRAMGLLSNLQAVEAVRDSPFTNFVQPQEVWVYQASLLILLQKRVGRKTESYPLYLVLLGYDVGLWTFLSNILFLVYNLARAYLTYTVGPLREAEERSGWSPTKADYSSLYIAHKVFSFIFIFAIASGLYSIGSDLLSPILVPV